MITDKIFLTNKQVIIIHDSEKRNKSLVGTVIPRGGNFTKEKKPKILKYEDLTTETQLLWNAKPNCYH